MKLTQFSLLIDGQLEQTTEQLNVINPATEEIVAVCPRATEQTLNLAIAAAKAAFPAWAATPMDERCKALNAIADIVERNKDELCRILTAEQGKPLGESEIEVLTTVAFFRYYASLRLEPEIIDETDEALVELHRKPLGVIGAITPWNFPLLIMAVKLPAALAAGNTVVLKPAPTTPLATLRLCELVAGALPAGVLNTITDDNDLGPKLTQHPDVAKISFTGSTATGKRVMSSVSDTLKRITLELGGNDAAIILGDVDPAAIAPSIYASAFTAAGQNCLGIKRLYVHDEVYDAVCDALSEMANAAIVDDGAKQGTTMGPLQNKAQFEKVKEMIQDAKLKGTIAAGGDVLDRKGYFIRPTIVRDVSEGARVVDEEQFGPILPVIKFSDAEDAINRANASPYGLGGSVWSGDETVAYQLAKKIESGTVWVNKHFDMAPHIPFSGAKESGMGFEFGVQGLHEYTQAQVVNMAKPPKPARRKGLGALIGLGA